MSSTPDFKGGCKCLFSDHFNYTNSTTGVTKCTKCSSVYPYSTGYGNNSCVCGKEYFGSPTNGGCYLCSHRDINSEPKSDKTGCKCKDGYVLTQHTSGNQLCLL